MKAAYQRLMEAAIAGRANEAVALLQAHVERTVQIILDDPGLFRGDAA